MVWCLALGFGEVDMSSPFIREVDLAHRLGYGQFEDFRRALSRGDVLKPAMWIGKGRKKHPLWSPEEADEWTRGQKKKSEDQAVADAIDAL